VYDLSNGAIVNDLEGPLLPSFKFTPFFDAEYLRNGTTYGHRFNEILIATYAPYLPVSFRMTLSALEWLGKIFNDTKRRAVSLRQLSFLYMCTIITTSASQVERCRTRHASIWNVRPTSKLRQPAPAADFCRLDPHDSGTICLSIPHLRLIFSALMVPNLVAVVDIYICPLTHSLSRAP